MIRKLMAFTVALFMTQLAGLVHAEVWKDYTPSEELTELVVVDVQPNYVDDYLMQIKLTWARAMEVQKEMGHVLDYGIWVANVSDTPNIFLTTTFKDAAAMQGSEERYDAIMSQLKEMGMDEDEQDAMSKGYENMREVVDYKLLRRITYK